MKIIDVSVAILRSTPTPTDNREQCALVYVTAEDGTVGYGEANANPAAVKALLETDFGLIGDWDDSPRSVLIGSDANAPRETWLSLKRSSFWSCRTGLGHVAVAAAGTALWDLAGKLAGKPTYQLLGEQRNFRPRAYATLYHGFSDIDETLKRTLEGVDRAIELGFTAVKVEPLTKNAPTADDIVDLVRQVRERVGDEFTLLADVGYRWQTANEGIAVARRLDEFGLYALEAPFPPHDVAAHLALADAIKTPLCTGDQLTSVYEYLPLLESGSVAFIQGGAARTGINDMDDLATRARALDKGFVSWGWVATSLTMAANLHLSLVHDNVPLIECAPPSMYPDVPLRNELFGPEPTITNGVFDLPTRPGLGVDIDSEALDRLRVA